MSKNINKNKLQKIFRESSVVFAYQFGSTVNNHATKESDVDIAVYFNSKLSRKERFEKRLQLSGLLSNYFKKKTDVVVLNDIRSLFFKYVIINEGKLIYDSPKEEHIDFECRTLGLYFDYQPFLELYNRNYVQKSI